MSNCSAVVMSHPTALATKRFWLGDDGKTRVEAYGEGKYFKAEVVPLDGLADLASLLELLSKAPRSFIVRGELIPGTNLDRVRRAKNASGEEPATLRERPRHWMMIDVDGLDPAVRVDWSTAAGCKAAAASLVAKLPPALQSAGYVWQVSSSAGMRPGLSMHLFYWLDRPLGEADLTRWAEFVNYTTGKKMLDVAVFRTVQPLYVAAPVFDHVLDPVAQRMGYVPGPAAALPRIVANNDAWRRKLEPLYFSSNNKVHDHIRDACASYFCAHGPDAPDDILRTALIRGVTKALELQQRDDYDEAKIETELASGREFARSRAAAGENLLLDRDGQPKGCIANVLAVMQSHPEWRKLLGWDVRHGRIERLRETPWGSLPGEWSDGDGVEAAQWFAKEKRMSVNTGPLLEAAMAFAHEIEIDPVADWLNSLEWDGVERINDWMIGWCGAEDSAYTRRVSRMWLIGAVARALKPGCKNDTVLVLQGATGIGKSTMLQDLAGADTTPWFATLTDEKDMLQKIHGPWLVELPELGPFRFMHHDKIKGFTSNTVDRFRTPYARLPIDKPRMCAMAITLNPDGEGWNNDATSARRFWPVDVTEIDRDAIRMAREQLFAEAREAFKAGEIWWVEDPNDADFVAEQSKVYATDAWEEIIMRILRDGGDAFAPGGRACTIKAGAEEFQLSDLLSVAFNNHRAERRDQTRVSKALTRLGYVSTGTLWKKVLTLPAAQDIKVVA